MDKLRAATDARNGTWPKLAMSRVVLAAKVAYWMTLVTGAMRWRCSMLALHATVFIF
jgi:hypothetical protein